MPGFPLGLLKISKPFSNLIPSQNGNFLGQTLCHHFWELENKWNEINLSTIKFKLLNFENFRFCHILKVEHWVANTCWVKTFLTKIKHQVAKLFKDRHTDRQTINLIIYILTFPLHVNQWNKLFASTADVTHPPFQKSNSLYVNLFYTQQFTYCCRNYFHFHFHFISVSLLNMLKLTSKY